MIVVNILLAENNAIDASFIKRALDSSKRLKVHVDHTEWLNSSLQLLRNKEYDLVLLDLGLEDSQGVDTAVSVIREAPNLPVVVLSGQEDMDIAQVSLRAGAQDFVVKSSDMTVGQLERVILYALQKKSDEVAQKQMLLESHARLSHSEGLRGKWCLVEPHILRIEDALSKLQKYLAQNAPAHYLEVDDILKQENGYLALRELRSILLLADEKHDKLTVPVSYGRDTDPGELSTPSAVDHDLSKLILSDWGDEWEDI